MKYFDSHAHYWDEKFMGQNELLPHLFQESLSGVVNVATSPKTAKLAIQQAKEFPQMVTALGIHPSDAQELGGDMDAHISHIKSLLQDPASRAVAVGEIGLDYYWQPVDVPLQMAYFEKQLDLAEELGLPVIVHDRDAHGDCFDTVCRHPHVHGVFHSYSGSLEMAKDLIRRGWYISFSGTLTFTNAKRVREVAENLPHDRVLIETDAPYLTPHPHRGKLNHSGYLSYTAGVLGEVWGISTEEAGRITEENARRLFNIPLLK